MLAKWHELFELWFGKSTRYCAFAAGRMDRPNKQQKNPLCRAAVELGFGDVINLNEVAVVQQISNHGGWR